MIVPRFTRKTARPRLSLAALALAAACAAPLAAPPALDFTDATLCAMDGMQVAEFPGPKGQVQYDRGGPEFYCDTVELLSALLRPEQQRRVAAAYTQDMAQASWDKPRGHWIDARGAYYVFGSRRTGSMGPTVATFAREVDAKAFAREYGGTVRPFAEIRPEMVALDGGVMKDGLTR